MVTVRVSRLAKIVLLYALFIGLAVFTVFPMLWLLGVALKSGGSVFGFPPQIIPWPITFKNFIEVWKTLPLLRFFVNSVFLAAAGIAIHVTLSAMAAYPLARMHFRGRNFIFTVLLATLILPGHVGLIVNFVTLSKLSLINTYIAVLLPGAVSVFGIFLLRQAYLTLPRELEDAARIDGASEFTIWWKIMTPLIAPQLATLAIFEFVALWNSFLWPLIVLKDPSKYPLAVGLLYLQGIFSHNTRLIAAGAVILMLPMIIVFLVFQRYFIRGLTTGAVQ